MKQLSKLQYLNLQHCKQLIFLPELSTTEVKFEKEFSPFKPGLSIFDCPKLREIEHCYNVVFSWIKPVLEASMKFSPFSRVAGVVIPGSQIPRWLFSKQNEGDSIIMDLHDVIEDPNWIGVACCAVFVSHHNPSNNTQYPPDRHSIGWAVSKSYSVKEVFVGLPINFKKDLVTVEMDHLLMMLFNRKFLVNFAGHCNIAFSFRLYPYHPPGLRLEVKSYEYRWLFEEDLQDLKSSMMFSANSSSRNGSV